MIINHCCGFIIALPRGQFANSVFEYYEDFSLDFLVIKTGSLYAELLSFSAHVLLCSSVDSERPTVLKT